VDNRTGFRRRGHGYLADQARSALGITGEVRVLAEIPLPKGFGQDERSLYFRWSTAKESGWVRGVIVRAQRLVVSVARLVLRELDMSATGGSRQFAKRLKSAFGQRRRLGRPVTSGLPR